MLSHEAIKQSISYKLLHTFFLYFFASASFHYMKGLIRIILKAFRSILLYSESSHFFIYIYKVGKKNMRSIALLTILLILICHLSLGFLMYKKIHYGSVAILFFLLMGTYCLKKNAIKYIISAFTDSVIFKILNKNI